MTREHCTLETALGRLALVADDGFLVGVQLRAGDRPPRPARGAVLRSAAAQLREYLDGTRMAFELPLRRPPGTTPFQHRVWDALLQIPRGETRTYGELAAQLGTSARAVGGACRRNPLPIVVPCHRVVARGGLGGFSGAWEDGPELAMKRALLDREKPGTQT